MKYLLLIVWVCLSSAVEEDCIPEVDKTRVPKSTDCEERWVFKLEIDSCSRINACDRKEKENSFKTLVECQDSSQTTIQTDCALLLDVGKCDGSIDRFFFNSLTRKCEKFQYTGCGGNGNNFNDLDTCVRQCSQGTSVINCEQRWIFSLELGFCSQINACGRKEKENSFKTLVECQDSNQTTAQKDDCFLPMDVGKCDGSIDRFFFNSHAGKCEKFKYSGCDGNGNNFKDLVSCVRNCSERHLEIDCASAKDRGSGNEYILRYFFNSVSSKCEPFEYSGCGGNNNNYYTSGMCAKICAGSSKRKRI